MDLCGVAGSGQEFAAGDAQGWGFWAGEGVEGAGGERVDDAADAGPEDGSAAHGAGLGAGVEGGGGQLRRGELTAYEGAGEAFGVLGGVASGWDGVVAGGDEDFAFAVDDEGAEGVGAVGAGGGGEVDGLAEVGQVLFGDGIG